MYSCTGVQYIPFPNNTDSSKYMDNNYVYSSIQRSWNCNSPGTRSICNFLDTRRHYLILPIKLPIKLRSYIFKWVIKPIFPFKNKFLDGQHFSSEENVYRSLINFISNLLNPSRCTLPMVILKRAQISLIMIFHSVTFRDRN